MSQAATRIVNAALVQLGEDPVADVEADPAPGRLVKILPHLQPAIDAVLVTYGWLCALEYATLTPSPTIPGNWKYPHHYLAPEGGLRFWTVERITGWERGSWRNRPVLRAVEGGTLNVAYVTRRDADALDANVGDAVAFELAARACQSLNGSVELALRLRGIADDAVLKAQGVDGQDWKGDEEMVVDRVAALRGRAL
jgi:hypothetical protein